MSGDSFEISAFWANRKETASECAERLARMLEKLAVISPAFLRWNETGYTRQDATTPFCKMPPTVDELTAIVQERIARKDFPAGQPWPEQGFRVWAWNAIDGPRGASFSFRAGVYGSHLPYPNQAEIRFASSSASNADVANPGTTKAMLEQLVAAWQPLWGGIFSLTYRGLRISPQPSMTREEIARRPIGPAPLFWNPGWMAYLSNDYSRLFAPPPDARVENLAGGGILVSTTDELFSSENSKHLAAADELGAALKRLEADVRARQ